MSPRPRQADPRFDHRGGTNTSFSEEILDATELRLTKNARIGFGDVVVRLGSKRVHAAAIGTGAAVKGLRQWDAPAGRQLVAIAGGNFYHKLVAAANFTEIASVLSTTRVARFATYRIGATIVLYIAESGLRSWDGTTLTTNIVGSPALIDIASYKGRLWGITGDKRLYGSKLFTPTEWSAGNGAIFADVETFDTEGLVRVGVVGSSLLLFKESNTAKLTGVDQSNISIDTDTTGVSNELGLAAPDTLVLLKDAAFGVSVRGPVWFTENGAQEIGDKILPAFTGADKALWASSIAEHHPDRNEIWLWIPELGDANNATGWIFNYLTQTWSGPMLGAPTSSFARYRRTDGSRTIVRGGYDGYVREEDLGAKDDVLSDGSAGASIVWDVQYPVLLFGAPDHVKNMRGRYTVNADLGVAGSQLIAYWQNERGDTGYQLITSLGAGVKPYPFKFHYARGVRLVCGFRGSSGQPTRILGWNPAASISRKGR